MAANDAPDTVNELLVAAYGLTVEQVRGLPAGAAKRVAEGRIAERAFENGVRDFLAVAITTPLVHPGEEYLRVALAAIPLARLGARQWAAGAGSDDEWAAFRVDPSDLRDQVLSLLRMTRRAVSVSDDSRWFMMHERCAPSGYSDPAHQTAFDGVLALARDTLSRPMKPHA